MGQPDGTAARPKPEGPYGCPIDPTLYTRREPDIVCQAREELVSHWQPLRGLPPYAPAPAPGGALGCVAPPLPVALPVALSLPPAELLPVRRPLGTQGREQRRLLGHHGARA